MKICKDASLKVPFVVVSDPDISIWQVIAFAQEHGAVVGERISINFFSEDPRWAKLYTKEKLKMALRDIRSERAQKDLVGRDVRIQIGTRDPRVELLGELLDRKKTADLAAARSTKGERMIGVKVRRTTLLDSSRGKYVVYAHSKPFPLIIKKYKVAYIGAC